MVFFNSGTRLVGLSFSCSKKILRAERIAVGVQAARSDADDDIAAPDGFLPSSIRDFSTTPTMVPLTSYSPR